MIIITRPGVTDEELDHIRERIEALGPRTHLIRGEHRTVVLCIGDQQDLVNVPMLAIPGVEAVRPVMKPYKLASRQGHEESSEVQIGDSTIGGKALSIIAGPCSVEGLSMLQETARHVKAAGATALRGGAFKPRSSPYAFDGLGEEGLKILSDVRAETGLPVVTEVMDTRQVDLVAEYADVLQIGARNMQNFSLLTEVGR
ncbi:MAG TPA: 3-deoxy-7-phosphoheptulonate synthase, partial [Gemmatimonadetes bacterium]|nr:3-deoxy-7-phosphoheptulonate synthase [Gemmatimonadota bacterium]